MNKVFNNFSVGKALTHSLDQAIAYERGKKTKAHSEDNTERKNHRWNTAVHQLILKIA
jgi:hypothetical protein